jgi:hyperosmotically inducible periplasmic protein
MRFKDSLMGWLAIAVLAAGCATTSTGPAAQPAAGTTSKAVSDARRAAEIHVAMLEQLGEDALRIETRVSGDKAVLTGSVSERSSQELAEEIALSVDGIDRVSNKISHQGAGGRAQAGGKRSTREVVEDAAQDAGDEVLDAALEARVGIELLEELGRHAFSIEVESTDGVVSLGGRLPDQLRKDLAIATAEKTPGVRKVLNLLKIRGG